MPFKYFLLIVLNALFFNSSLWGQFSDSPPPTDNPGVDSSKIEILHISTFKERTTPQGIFRDLIGDVHLKQKETHIWCDTGYLFPIKQVQAHGNVQMLQNDSIRIFSDSLFYDGISRQSKLRQNVVLKDTSMTLFTEKLDYDLNTKIATFPEGSLIESDTTTMVSKRGTYNTNTNIAHFEDSVRVTNPNYKLTADSLEFNTQTEMAFFIGPTKVYNEDKMVYCEDGFYDSQRNYAELYKNARFENHEDGKNEIATGDTIVYDGEKDVYYLIGNAHHINEEQEVFADTILMDGETEEYYFLGKPKFLSRDSTQQQSIDAQHSTYNAKTKTMIFRGDVVVEQENQIIMTDSLDYNSETKNGIARGNVVWQDTVADLQIECEQAYYNDSSKYLLAHTNAILTTLIDNDSLWLRADTLISIPDTLDPDRRNLKAYHQVEVFKSDLQAICDSLFYNDIDSTFHFYINPILWVDGTQFTADTINVQMKNSQMHQVLLFDNSFIVNTNDEVYFNQIKGKDMLTQFVDGNISTMTVYEKGETVYYAIDEADAYVGVNDVDSDLILMSFKDNRIKRISYKGKSTGVLYPMHQVNHQSLQLEGFQWLDSLHIKTKYEFFGLPEPVFVVDSNTTIAADNPLIDSSKIDSIDLDTAGLSDSSQFINKDIEHIEEKASNDALEDANNYSKKKKKKSPKRREKKKKD